MYVDLLARSPHIHYGWQFMLNYPQSLCLKHSNTIYPFLISTHNTHNTQSTHNIIIWWNKICFEQTVTKHIYLIIVVLFLALTEYEK